MAKTDAIDAAPSRKTVYVVQSFEMRRMGRRMGLGPSAPVAARDDGHARLLLERALHRTGIVGAVAFSRTGDPSTGEFDEPVIIGQVGEVPEELV